MKNGKTVTIVNISESQLPHIKHIEKQYLPSRYCHKDYINCHEESNVFTGAQEGLCKYLVNNLTACKQINIMMTQWQVPELQLSCKAATALPAHTETLNPGGYNDSFLLI